MTDPTPAAPRATFRQRLVAGSLATGVAILRRLPEGLVYRTAWSAGLLLARLLPDRRRRVHANLTRVVRYCAAEGLGTERARAAATDPALLDRCVREVFGHWLVTYAESALGASYPTEVLRRRFTHADPAAVEAGLAAVPPGALGRIYTGIHFGAVEMAGLYAARFGHVPLAAPMETVANPALQAYFERTRGALGVDVLPLKGATAIARDRLARGLGIAFVADRAMAGGGARVPFFGATAKVPAGPAVLAADTGAPMAFIAMKRLGFGRWEGSLEMAVPDATLPRRERAEALLRDHVRWMERMVASAPEQWWTLLFPIWEDEP